MRLADLPSHVSLVVDANCFIYHFTGTHPSCAVLFERASRGDVRLFVSTTILTEVHHRLMLLEAALRLPHPPSNLPRFLKHHPELIRTTQRCEQALNSLRKFRLKVLPVTPRLLNHARRLSHEFGLLTNDALTVALLYQQRITHLASNDADFLRIPDITLWRP